MKMQAKTIPAKRRAGFTLIAPEARKVSLVGEFNQWNPKKHPMKKENNGQWAKTVYLSPGTYEYKYWVDGAWRLDDHNAQQRQNCYGSSNNLITITPKR